MRNRCMRVALLFLGALAIGGAWSQAGEPEAKETGKSYYVATTGDDGNPGTKAAPWKTLQKAVASVQPGDTVRIKAGEYFVGAGLNVSRAGTADKPITYQAYGDGAVRITNSSVIPADGWTHVKGKVYSTSFSQPAICVFQNDTPLYFSGNPIKISSTEEMIQNSSYKSGTTLYVWLEDGSDPGKSVMRASPGNVINLSDCHHNVFDGLTVEYGYTGFKLQRDATHHITIRNCVIRAIGNQGIQPVAKDCVIENNLFQKIGSNKHQHGIYGSQPRTIVRHNVFEEMAGCGIHQFHTGDPAGGECEFYGNVFRKPLRMAIPVSPSSKTYYYTDIIASGEGNNRIYNNVFYGEGKRSGIGLSSGNNRIYNNTFVGCAVAIGFKAGATGNQVVSNIFLDAARSFVGWPANALPQTLDHNIYFSASAPPKWEREGVAYPTFNEYQKAAGETHSRYVDPFLAGPADAHLKAGSPAIDAGAVLKEITVDIDGAARPQGIAPDIGAYEFEGAAAKAAPAQPK